MNLLNTFLNFTALSSSIEEYLGNEHIETNSTSQKAVFVALSIIGLSALAGAAKAIHHCWTTPSKKNLDLSRIKNSPSYSSAAPVGQLGTLFHNVNPVVTVLMDKLTSFYGNNSGIEVSGYYIVDTDSNSIKVLPSADNSGGHAVLEEMKTLCGPSLVKQFKDMVESSQELSRRGLKENPVIVIGVSFVGQRTQAESCFHLDGVNFDVFRDKKNCLNKSPHFGKLNLYDDALALCYDTSSAKNASPDPQIQKFALPTPFCEFDVTEETAMEEYRLRRDSVTQTRQSNKTPEQRAADSIATMKKHGDNEFLVYLPNVERRKDAMMFTQLGTTGGKITKMAIHSRPEPVFTELARQTTEAQYRWQDRFLPNGQFCTGGSSFTEDTANSGFIRFTFSLAQRINP